ncbi:MAG: Tetratricopeptide repeat-containing protein [Flavipsychrobacter sp.]|nr:Tetratricopeptide repeat-containing protein [Flavipsychrobacter sp.]
MRRIFILLASVIVSISAHALDISKLKMMPLSDSLQCKMAEPAVLECAEYLLSRPCGQDSNAAEIRNFLYAWMMKTPAYHFNFQDPLFLIVQKDKLLFAHYLACQSKVALSEAGGISNTDLQLKYVSLFLEYCSNPANNAKLPVEFLRLEEQKKIGRLPEAIVASYVDGLRRIIDTASNDSIKLFYLNAIKFAYTDVSLDSIVFYAQQVVHFSMKHKDSFRPGAEARALNDLGSALWYAGNYPEAKETFFKALAKAEELADTMLIGLIYNGLAMVNRNEGNPRQAIEYYSKTEQLTRHIPDNNVLLDALTYKGKAYEQLDILDSAYAYTQQALAMQHRKYRGNNIVGGTVQANMGIIYSKMGKPDTAAEYFHLSFRLSTEVNDQRRLARAYCEFAEHFFRYKRQDSAIYYATKGWLIDRQHRFLVQELAASTLLTRLYTVENKIDSAFKYQQLMIETRDSLFSREKVNRLQTLEFNEQFRQKELQAARMAAAEERERNIQFALIAIGILTFIILFLLLSRTFITNERWIEFFGVIALLVVFEFLTLLAHPLLGRITHHSPVLMLLTQVIIAGLIVPMHHKLEKWAIAKLVEKNKAVRLARANKAVKPQKKS